MEALYLLSYGSMAPPAGLEPATYRLTAGRSTIELRRIIRLTARYSIHQCTANIKMKFLGWPPGSDLLSRGLPPPVPSALEGLTSVFGMGTGGSPPLLPPDGMWLRMLRTLKIGYGIKCVEVQGEALDRFGSVS